MDFKKTVTYFLFRNNVSNNFGSLVSLGGGGVGIPPAPRRCNKLINLALALISLNLYLNIYYRPQRSSRDVIHPTPVGQSHPLSDQPTHVFPSTTSAEQYHHQHHHTQHKSKSHHHSKHKKTAVPATSSDPFNTHAYTQVNSPPLVAPVFTTSSSTTNSVPYSTGTLPKSRSSNLPSSVTSPSGGLPGVAGGCSHSASFAGAVDANQYPIVSGSGCHGSCCKSRSG